MLLYLTSDAWSQKYSYKPRVRWTCRFVHGENLWNPKVFNSQQDFWGPWKTEMHDFHKAVGIALGVQTRCHPSTQKSPLPSASSASRKKIYIMTENFSVYNNALGQRVLFGSINFSVLINGQVWFHFCLSYLEKQQIQQQFVTVKEIQSENSPVRLELRSALKTTTALETPFPQIEPNPEQQRNVENYSCFTSSCEKERQF